MAPNISFQLYGDKWCMLDRSRDFAFTLMYDLQFSQSITVNAKNTIFDPSAAFAQGFLEIFNAETGERIDLPSPQDEDGSVSLVILNPKISGRYSIWSTDPSASGRTNPEPHIFDLSLLAPNINYTIRLRAHGIKTWYPGEHTNLSALPDPGIEPIPEPSKHSSFTFQTRARTPQAPPLKPTVHTSSDTLSIKGDPPFIITLKWALDTDRKEVEDSRGIAVLRSIPHGRNKAGVEIRDGNTGKRRGPTLGWRPPEDGPSPPEEVEILRFASDRADEYGGKWVDRSYTLVTDTGKAGIFGTDTRVLKAGNVYVVGAKKSKWAWLRREDVGEAVWVDDEKLEAALRKEPRVSWQIDASTEVQAVE